MKWLLWVTLMWITPAALSAQSAGSLFITSGPLSNAARDVKAAAPGDIVTIVVSDRASAAATGGTNTTRQSTGANEITSLIGTLAAGNPLGNLLDFSNQRAIQSDGETTREMNLTTTLSARVVALTLNGLLVIEGTKESVVNSERQVVTVRGMIRAVDITPFNTILSNQISDLTVQVNGKGVVNDAIRRPFILYRLLADFLPF